LIVSQNVFSGISILPFWYALTTSKIPAGCREYSEAVIRFHLRSVAEGVPATVEELSRTSRGKADTVPGGG
jgi:hypothetical protein